MTERRELERLEEACAEHDRLALALAVVRETQERILVEVVNAQRTRLDEVATDLRFAVDGARAHGVALDRGFYLVVDEERAWSLLERHAHGMQSIAKRVTVRALLDAFGRDTARMVLDALAAEARVPAPIAAPARPLAPTRDCPHCDAHPNVQNYARHLRTIHGLGVNEPKVPAVPSARHQVCRLCGARLSAGRLDPHLTAMHGIFHVHPQGDRESSRRESARRSTQSRSIPSTVASRPIASGRPARDFLAETRHERTLVARADSPLRDRDRQGRFSDAPDVERMDGDSRS